MKTPEQKALRWLKDYACKCQPEHYHYNDVKNAIKIALKENENKNFINNNKK